MSQSCRPNAQIKKKHHPNCNREGKNGKSRSKLTSMGGMFTTCLLVTERLQKSSEEHKPTPQRTLHLIKWLFFPWRQSKHFGTLTKVVSLRTEEMGAQLAEKPKLTEINWPKKCLMMTPYFETIVALWRTAHIARLGCPKCQFFFK